MTLSFIYSNLGYCIVPDKLFNCFLFYFVCSYDIMKFSIMHITCVNLTNDENYFLSVFVSEIILSLKNIILLCLYNYLHYTNCLY